MGSIYVSFIVKSLTSSVDNNSEILDKTYQSLYKPVIKFLYSHPSFPLSFFFSGTQLEFFKKRKNELVAIIREMTDRSQVEILGGAYYNAPLPLLNSVDRNGQIDSLTSEIRLIFGKRPRGMTLFQDCWDSSLVNNIHTCGIEYVILDSSLVQDSKRCFLPILMSDLGKNVDIYPSYDEFIPDSDILPEEFLWNIEKSVLKVEKKDTHLQLDADRIILIAITPEKAFELTNSKWFDKLEKYLSITDTRIKLITTNNFRQKNVKTKLPDYIPIGINPSITKLIQNDKTEKNKFPNTIYDFLYNYKASSNLYNRMMYVAMLVNQYKNDKMRKNAAREKLWLAQNGLNLISSSPDPLENSINRQFAYKILTDAEKILRGDGNFKESVTCFDYDNDGLDEYVCRMEQYFAYISLNGGTVRELDVMKNTCNYADNLMRSELYDSYNDDYERGFFIDHLFTMDQFKKYEIGEPAGDGVFSRIQYSETKYSQTHREVTLCAKVIWKPTGQQIYLRKKYIINSTGMYVQYIIKNESNKILNAKFVVESNIANVFFRKNNKSDFNIETVDNGSIIIVDPSKSTSEINKSGKLNNIQIVRISDSLNGISFVFEPNEKCGFCMNPIIFRRPSISSNEIQPVNMTYASSLFWNINIEPGRETEKSINFTIIPVKKIKK